MVLNKIDYRRYSPNTYYIRYRCRNNPITFVYNPYSIITATKGKANKEISYDTANASNIRSEIFDKKTRTQLHDEYRQETNYLWC